MDLSVIAFIKLAASGDKLGLNGATNQIFCLQQQSSKHDAFWLRCNSRRNSTSSYLCSCISPLATFHSTASPSYATHPLSVASRSYNLFFTSGLHPIALAMTPVMFFLGPVHMGLHIVDIFTLVRRG
jgi:hypothetical protein